MKQRWETEPDLVVFYHRGFKCIIFRHPHFGNLNGYLGVPKGHPWHRKNHDHVEGASVHGGLTYSAGCASGKYPSGPPRACFDTHKRRPGDREADTDEHKSKACDNWFLGFDTCHAGDHSPYIASLLTTPAGKKVAARIRRPSDVYRDIEYVTKELKRLAEQAEAIADGHIDPAGRPLPRGKLKKRKVVLIDDEVIP